MAVGDNRFQSYTSIGNREDLTDVITNISPMDTWFTSTIGSEKCNATYHEWQTDALAAAAANTSAEGVAFTDVEVVPTARVGNYTQILKKVFMITKTQETIDKAGRKSEIAYQTEKKMKELARDIEYAFIVNSSSLVGSGATGVAAGSARQLKGVDGWIATNINSGSGTADVMTELRLNDALQTIWAAGGKPSTVVCGAGAKRAVSGFTTNTRYMVADENKLASAVDVYQSDFGTITVRLHHQVSTSLPTKAFIFGDMSLWAKAWLRPVTRSQQPYAGDADLFSIIGECTLVSRQEKGSGKLTNLNYSV